MSRHDVALILYGVGVLAILFSLIRTYYLVGKVKRETDARMARTRAESLKE